jgi:hypothetical protein
MLATVHSVSLQNYPGCPRLIDLSFVISWNHTTVKGTFNTTFYIISLYDYAVVV